MITTTRFGLAGIIVAVGFALVAMSREADTQPTQPTQPAQASEFVWTTDGFLDKDYSEPLPQISKVTDDMFAKCVAVSTEVLGNKGLIRSSGVGDQDGKWKMWGGVGTIRELDVKKGGIVVAVKLLANDKTTTVGFKVGEGDRKASETLHRLLAERLSKTTSQPTASRPSISQPSTAPTVGAHASPDRTLLERITADQGARFDPQNEPQCTLRSLATSELPKEFKAEINGFINWPKDYQPPKAAPYGDDETNRIVAAGIYYTQVPPSIGEGGGFRCIGEFLVDKSLNPFIGIWDGKKEGAVHTIKGKLTMFEYEFDSDGNSPLKFKITKDGYVYLEGKGTVIDLKVGKKYTFPNRLAGEQDGELLRQAASEGNVQKVKELLDRGVDVNSRSQRGVTPLMLACAEGQIDVVKLLLARGADVNATDNSGRTALGWADLVRLPAQPRKDSTGMISIVDEKTKEKDEIKVLLKNQEGK